MRLIIVTIVLIFLCSCSKDKIAYVNTQVVFNGFEYKKELEKEFMAIQSQRKYVLDSMQTNLKILSNKYKLDKSNKDIIAEYQASQELFEEKKTMSLENTT